MKIDENTISEFTPQMLLSTDVWDELYDMDDTIERTRLISLMMVRAKQCNVVTAIKSLHKAFEKEERRLSAAYAEKHEMNLKYTSDGRLKDHIDNFAEIIRKDPVFKDIRYNELRYRAELVCGDKIERWTDADDARLRAYIESRYGIYSPLKSDGALRIILEERKFHPVRSIIESIVWDGKPRMDQYLIKWGNADDNEYTREVSRLIFAGGINRIYRPGCKYEDVPVLMGGQGSGKSTLVRFLSIRDDFFSEVNEIDGQKGMEAVEGAWICEVSELLALTRAKDVEAAKSYFSRQIDQYRRPYDRQVTERPRQCIFIGTTNNFEFLTDKTGNRRYYPVAIHQNGYYVYDHEREIREYVLQCWAESKAKLDCDACNPYLDKSLIPVARDVQKEAVEDDYRIGMIQNYLEDKRETCVVQIWKYALGNDFSTPSRKDSFEISKILRSMPNWERNGMSRFGEFGPQKAWVKTGNNKPELPFLTN